MNCREAQTLIHKELDGDLGDDERRLLIAHVHNCRRCRAMREGLHHLAAAVRELPAPLVPSAGLEEAVTRSLRRRRRLRRTVGAGLAAAAGILLLLMLWPQGTPTAPLATGGPSAHQAPEGRGPGPGTLPDLSPEAFRAWVEDAWEKAAGEAGTEPPSVEITLIAADYKWQGKLQRDLQETKSALLQMARAVGKQVFPFELPQPQRQGQNG